MAKFRNRLWLWGQSSGTHDAFFKKYFNETVSSKMTPLEGSVYLGIPNICRVVMAGKPVPPYDQEMMPLEKADKVIWSIVGSVDSKQYVDGMDEVDELLRLSEKHDNIIGGILDDILAEQRNKIFTPEKIRKYADILHSNTKRRLELWSVIYEFQLEEWAVPYLEECDVYTFWTWDGANLVDLEDNVYKVKKLFPNKPVYIGVYMWDYEARVPLTDEQMQRQLDIVYRFMKEKVVEGAIICSNCIADIGLKAVDMTRAWIEKHADEEI